MNLNVDFSEITIYLEIILAVGKSQGSDRATKSPKLDILSAPRALA